MLRDHQHLPDRPGNLPESGKSDALEAKPGWAHGELMQGFLCEGTQPGEEKRKCSPPGEPVGSCLLLLSSGGSGGGEGGRLTFMAGNTT